MQITSMNTYTRESNADVTQLVVGIYSWHMFLAGVIYRGLICDICNLNR